MIGITKNANLSLLLEKRVLSRLNAQFVHLPPASTKNILSSLAISLSIPEEIFETNNSGNNSDKILPARSTRYRRDENRINQNVIESQEGGSITRPKLILSNEEKTYYRLFNEQICLLFGRFTSNTNEETDFVEDTERSKGCYHDNAQ